MLEIIHALLGLFSTISVIIYIILMCKSHKKSNYDRFRSNFIFSLILCIVYIIKIIISFTVPLSFFLIGSNILCGILWVYNAISDYNTMKSAENKSSGSPNMIYLDDKDIRDIE